MYDYKITMCIHMLVAKKSNPRYRRQFCAVRVRYTALLLVTPKLLGYKAVLYYCTSDTALVHVHVQLQFHPR